MNRSVPANVSRETVRRIDAYLELLLHWNRRLRLVGRADRAALWDSHVADSLLLSEFLWDARVWVDLGSGNGLPVCVLACAAQAEGLPVRFHAIESDRRKAVFLREAARQLALPITVHAQRIEQVEPLEATHVSAKALASTPRLIELAAGVTTPGAKLLFLKGRQPHGEIQQTVTLWTMRYHLRYTRTGMKGHMLIIEAFHRA